MDGPTTQKQIDEAVLEHLVLYGTGDGVPLGIFSTTPAAAPPKFTLPEMLAMAKACEELSKRSPFAGLQLIESPYVPPDLLFFMPSEPQPSPLDKDAWNGWIRRCCVVKDVTPELREEIRAAMRTPQKEAGNG
jgi:hypothetical protein